MSRIPKDTTVDVLGNTVMLHSSEFSFSYTPADLVVKDEFKGQYEYFGGLQHGLPEGSEELKLLERELVEFAKLVLLAAG